jgi:two-component system, chemotaxis family, sensor kinase Cph1
MVIRQLMRQKQALKDVSLELERSNGELTSFASVVAHDLRGSLNTVGLFAQLLSNSSSVKADAECIESLGSIQAELNRLSRFIESLLAYGRVGSGEIRLQVCDCASVLSDVRRNLTADLKRNSVAISNDPLPVIRADPVLIAQLVQNLIENSIKYHGEAIPRIHVSAARQSDGWLFSVQDNGIGIRPEDSERIFKPFCQADAGKLLGNGVGLGLATCKRIVERHRGHIHVESKPGEGTRFVFTIPESQIKVGYKQ